MKTIILAGGWGTRLGQHTEWIPKPMVQIGDRPMIWHIMSIYAHYGFKDFIVSAGVKANVIKEYFLNYEAYTGNFSKNFDTGETSFFSNSPEIDWRVTIVDTGGDTLKGARVKRISHLLDSDVNMVTYGDGLADIDLRALYQFHMSHGRMVTMSGVRPPARFGEIIEKNGQVMSFSEKPQTSRGLVNGGFMVFSRGLLDHLSSDQDCDLEFGALELLAADGEVMVYKHDGNWECVDHERDLNHMISLWETGQAFWKLWD